ncbi:MAG: hypothetical protein J1E07_05145 [Treponema sp.]|nr:hypothetical protein [Treponema sp.]
MPDTRRIARNTLFLYFRQILIMAVSLYTVRVVLAVLGAEDYGIYNVVAGTVTMLGFLSGAMATASQRYFSFDLGRGDTEHLRTTFSVTLQIYAMLALIVLLLAETAGLWLVNRRLVIPPARMAAANCIYQAAVVSFMLTLLNAPYMAGVIAHEDMGVYAYASIAETAMKLAVVFLLRVLPFDRLSVYGILLAAVAFVNTSVYRLWCRKKYDECRFRMVRDGALLREMVSYSGWNLFGSGASMVRNQGMTVMLNLFFGSLVSAARAVAVQVNAAMLSFAQNFSTALRPQIIKLYAADERDSVLRMVLYATKTVFFLMLVITVPVFFSADSLLALWLKNVPEHTVRFVRLVLVDVLIDSISYPLMAVMQATGKIRLYQTAVGGLLIMNLPVSYLFLRLGFSPESVFAVAIVLSVCALALRILIVQRQTGFGLVLPFVGLLARFALLVALSAMIPAVVWKAAGRSFWGFCIFALVSVLWTALVLFIFGLNRHERGMFMERLRIRRDK